MEYLRKNYSVFFSPKFHGLLAYIILTYLQARGLLGGPEIAALASLVALTTGVGVVESVARKIGRK